MLLTLSLCAAVVRSDIMRPRPTAGYKVRSTISEEQLLNQTNVLPGSQDHTRRRPILENQNSLPESGHSDYNISTFKQLLTAENVLSL